MFRIALGLGLGLGDNSRWCVQLAAIGHWYLALAICIKCIMCVHSPFIFFFNIVSINWTEWSTIPTCPSLLRSFNRGNIEGTNSSKMCVTFVYVCFVLCLRSDWLCGLT